MSSFEFVFGLISVVTSLALTQMLGGCVALYRRSDRLRLSWRHALWTATAFMLLISNWAMFWGYRNVKSWSALDVLIPLIFVSFLYAFCDLVLPDKDAVPEILDLREYHVREGHRYKRLQLILTVISMIYIAHETSSFAQWASAAMFAMIAALVTLIALRTRSIWLDTVTAATLTVLAALFMSLRMRVF